MRQHKCGTCRFYQEARLASSGWCHHPQRKTTNDLMIMVRKNELACRDEWSHDLWEARANQSGADAAPLTELFPDRKMPPATESEIAALLHAERSPNGAAGDVSGHGEPDDVVLSELGAPTERPTPRERPDIVPAWATPTSRTVELPPAPAPISELGTRSAIIRARETYRERSRLQAARASEITRLTAKADREQPASESVDVNPPVVDVIQEVNLVAAIGTSDDPPAKPLTSKSDEVLTARADDEPTIQSAGSALDDKRDHQDVSSESSPLESPIGGARPQAVQGRDAELTWLNEQPEFAAASGPEQPRPWPAEEEATFGPSSVERSALNDNVDLDYFDRADDPQSSSALLDSEEYEAEQTASEQWIDDVVVDYDYEDDRESPPGLDLAAHLPRICRTCRDFRPAENGDRGWCANQWAFSHRRMVDADERTPCEGVLGHWWLPVDEVWSEAADVSSHGQPTPLLDAWLPQPLQKEPTRRRS